MHTRAHDEQGEGRNAESSKPPCGRGEKCHGALPISIPSTITRPPICALGDVSASSRSVARVFRLLKEGSGRRSQQACSAVASSRTADLARGQQRQFGRRGGSLAKRRPGRAAALLSCRGPMQHLLATHNQRLAAHLETRRLSCTPVRAAAPAIPAAPRRLICARSVVKPSTFLTAAAGSPAVVLLPFPAVPSRRRPARGPFKQQKKQAIAATPFASPLAPPQFLAAAAPPPSPKQLAGYECGDERARRLLPEPARTLCNSGCRAALGAPGQPTSRPLSPCPSQDFFRVLHVSDAALCLPHRAVPPPTAGVGPAQRLSTASELGLNARAGKVPGPVNISNAETLFWRVFFS